MLGLSAATKVARDAGATPAQLVALERLCSAAFEGQRTAEEAEMNMPATKPVGDRQERRVMITRHGGALEWLKAQPGWEGAEQMVHLHRVEPGVHYCGILPVDIIAEIVATGGRFTALVLDFPDVTYRGRELTIAEMGVCKASLVEYTASKV